MDKLEFYGGVNEIGGNKIRVNMDDTSLFLDFGMSFSKSGKYFSEFINPRKGNGICDFLELGLIPKIKGIYREDYLKHMGLPFQDKPAIEGVLLSHAHADHSDCISHLREDIPIYMSLNSKIILEVIDKTGINNGFKDIYRYKRQFEYYLNTRGTYSKRLSKNEFLRDIRVMDPYKTYNIGNLDVKLAPVDHSLPGASAFLIEGSDERMVYTGDLRFHGRNREYTKKFVKEAIKFSPEILICEGTRIDSGTHKHSNDYKALELEEDIEEKVLDLINGYDGLVIANFPLRDLDRLVTFYNIAKLTDRKILINTKQAYMLKLIEEENPEKTIYPSINDDTIGIYIPRKGSGLNSPDVYVSNDGNWEHPTDDEIIKDYSKWEREFLEYDNSVTYKDVKENENQYIIRLDNFSFLELIDIQPENAIYIHSNTEPFNEEMEMNFAITKNWLNHFGIEMYPYFHVSGHARGPQLLEMVREIHPDILYPVHTEHAEIYDTLNDEGIKIVHPVLKH